MEKYIFGVLLVAIFSYLMGSINFAIIISKKLSGGDIRQYGSGNAGMTNMLRTFGKKVAVFTAVGDFCKALIAVVVSRYLIFPLFGITAFDAGYISGFFVLLGHIFPVFFSFKGGKGVMAALGVMFVLDPVVFIGVLASGLIGIYFTHMVSVGSLIGAITLPIYTLIYRLIQKKPFVFDTVGCLIIAALVIFMHRENIKRIISGTENRFGSKKK